MSLHTVIVCAVVGMRLLPGMFIEERPYLLLTEQTLTSAYTVLYDTDSGRKLRLAEYSLISAPTHGKHLILTNGQAALLHNLNTHEQTPAYIVFTRNNDWSPDGTKMIGDIEGNIYLFHVNTNNTQSLTSEGNRESFARWSPDGEQIAFVRFDERNNSNIYIRSSTAPEDVTQYTFLSTGRIQEIALSPDGRFIAYSVLLDEEPNQVAIRIVDVETLEDRIVKTVDEGGFVPDIAWSPDGNTLYLLEFFAPSTRQTYAVTELNALNLSTGEEHLLSSEWITSIHISPDGEWLALFSTPGSGGWTTLLNPATGERRPILPDTYSVSSPHWITLP
ncbi:MAG: DPP IV N-terminal domain-containing protein [Chloroflexota bacterium]